MKSNEEMELFFRELRKSGKAVIVEGKKDRAALCRRGIKNIYSIDSKPLFAVIESVAKKEKDVLVLTDLDREGKRIYSVLSSGLQGLGVRVDNYFREFLFRKTKIRQIEGV